MNVFILGPGAIGRMLAARFQLAGIAVTVLDYRENRAHQLEREGILLEERDAETIKSQRVGISVQIVGDRGGVSRRPPRGDLLISCVKAYDTERALAAGVAVLKPTGRVLVLSNGLGNLESAEKVWKAKQCLAGALVWGAERRGPNGVVTTRSSTASGGPPLRLGFRAHVGSSASARRSLEKLTRLFERAGLAAEPVDDIESVIWQKVAINCAVNPLGAIFGVENGKLPQLPAFSVGVAAASEAAAVARSRGITLPEEGWGERVSSVCQATATNRCSMLLDIEAGRKTEIGALCRRVFELARAQEMSTPVNWVFTEVITTLELLSTTGETRQPSPPTGPFDSGRLRTNPALRSLK